MEFRGADEVQGAILIAPLSSRILMLNTKKMIDAHSHLQDLSRPVFVICFTKRIEEVAVNN
jgi:hypothetical protein